jgi:ribosomal protein S21
MKRNKYKNRFKRREPLGPQSGTCLEVKARDGETAEALAMRFKRQVKRTGLHDEIRNAYMERFKSKSEKKREKHLRALKRLKRNQNRY